jgi:hypothetical protein
VENASAGSLSSPEWCPSIFQWMPKPPNLNLSPAECGMSTGLDGEGDSSEFRSISWQRARNREARARTETKRGWPEGLLSLCARVPRLWPALSRAPYGVSRAYPHSLL